MRSSSQFHQREPLVSAVAIQANVFFMNYTVGKSLVNYITARHGVFVINIYKYISRREKNKQCSTKTNIPSSYGLCCAVFGGRESLGTEHLVKDALCTSHRHHNLAECVPADTIHSTNAIGSHLYAYVCKLPCCV